jgi:uroporphyrinogen-III synthase
MRLSGKTIFISRELDADSYFRTILEKENCNVHAKSLISISKIRYTYTPQTNWIFFTSKNAIDFFLVQKPDLPKEVKFAVISKASGNHLQKHGLKPDFVGEGVSLMNIAKDFRETLKNDSVLFPQAIDSYQTIQKQLAFTNTCYNLYVYKTNICSGFDIPFSDVLIFTSPSNATGYYQKYKHDVRQIVIAMGTSTKNKLNEYGVNGALMPDAFDENGIVDLLMNQVKS